MESDVRSSAISTDPVECSSCNSVDLCMDRHFILQVTVYESFEGILDAHGQTVVSQTDDLLAFDKYAADFCAGILTPAGNFMGQLQETNVPLPLRDDVHFLLKRSSIRYLISS